MTPGAVRVTVARVCSDCNGMGNQYSDCCQGEGVVWEPVSCAGCKHVGHYIASVLCTQFDYEVNESFACAAWEPRES